MVELVKNKNILPDPFLSFIVTFFCSFFTPLPLPPTYIYISQTLASSLHTSPLFPPPQPISSLYILSQTLAQFPYFSNGRYYWLNPENVVFNTRKDPIHLAMLALQFGYAGFHVVSRAALNMGISKIVFPVYRNILALILLVPFAYFLEKKERPPLTLSFVVQFFLLAVVGITANQGFYLLGLDNTSPTFASAIQNSVPAITFLMAAVLRIEQVRLNRKDGIAKVMGTILCVAGASVITLYKGPTIYSPGPPLQRVSPALLSLGDAEGKNWTLGCIFLIGHCLSWAGWLVLQAPILKKYPARLSFTSYQCFFGVLQFLVIAAFLERDPQAWLVHSGGELLSVFYAGVVASGIAFAVQIWCIDRGGPVFVAVYQPVQTLVVAIMASLALGEQFYLGGIIGAVLIISGLYFVLWGKSEERKFAAQKPAIQSPADHSNSRTPIHIKSSLAQPLLPQSTENV